MDCARRPAYHGPMSRSTTSGIAIVRGLLRHRGSFARRLAAAVHAGKERYRVSAFDELWWWARRADRLDALARELSALSPSLRWRAALPADMASGRSALLEAELAARPASPSSCEQRGSRESYGPFSAAAWIPVGQIPQCRVPRRVLLAPRPFMGEGALVIKV
jgi:hypothetical protein